MHLCTRCARDVVCPLCVAWPLQGRSARVSLPGKWSAWIRARGNLFVVILVTENNTNPWDILENEHADISRRGPDLSVRAFVITSN